MKTVHHLFVFLAWGIGGAFAIQAQELNRIEITPSNPTLTVGDTTTFSAKGFDAQGDEVTIGDPNWQGDGKSGYLAVNPTNAQQCTYTPTNRGNGYVSCYDGEPGSGGKQGSSTIVVKAAPSSRRLARIEVKPSNVTLQVGDTTTFSAKGFDQNGDEIQSNVTWTATGGSITSNGYYTATNAGNYLVTAMSEGGIQGTAAITITYQLARIEITPRNVTLQVNDTTTFSAKGFEHDGDEVNAEVEWSASGGGTISSDGEYTATDKGTWEVTAENPITGKKETASIAVAPDGPLTTIEVTPANPTLNVGDTQVFEATKFDESGDPVSGDVEWTTTGGGTVSTGGVYVATETGDYVVMATATNGVRGSARLNVIADSQLTTIGVTPNNVTLNIGDTQTFIATGRDRKGDEVSAEVEWTASGGGSITAGGQYTATSKGTWEVTATDAVTGKRGTASIAVEPDGPLTTIEVTPANPTLNVGDTQVFEATKFDESGDPVSGDVTWTTTGGGTISTGGLYTATETGIYSIHATASNGVRGTIQITNRPAPFVAWGEITPVNITLQIGDSQTFIADGFDQHGDSIAVTADYVSVEGLGTVTPNPTNASMCSYQATGAGMDTLRCRAGSGVYTYTAAVQIVNTTWPLVGFEIYPAYASVMAGRALTLQGVATELFGPSYNVTPNWTTTGGEMQGNSFVCLTSGVYAVTGTLDNGLSNTVQITVLPLEVGMAVASSTQLQVSVLSGAGSAYSLQRSGELNLPVWTNMPQYDHRPGTGGELNMDIPRSDSIGIYRVLVGPRD